MAPVPNVSVAGVMAMDCSVMAVTVSVVLPVTPLAAALMVVEPMATALATPDAEMLAIDVALDVQLAEALRSFVVPSE